jgi:GNAT superfamily N-acetyltransferase
MSHQVTTPEPAWAPTMIPGTAFSWRSQARQYPASLSPVTRFAVELHLLARRRTIVYVVASSAENRLLTAGEVHRHRDAIPGIDCLLLYSASGRLQGILNHYPRDEPPYERAGNVNLYVHPDHRRQGIGTALLREAVRRWAVDPRRQRYSPAGYELAKSVWPDPTFPPPAQPSTTREEENP